MTYQPPRVFTPGPRNPAIQLFNGCAKSELSRLPNESVHIVVTDPPYFLHEQGDDWDHETIKQRAEASWGRYPSTSMRFDPNQSRRLRAFMGPIFCQCLRVLKPGGFCIAFAQARLCHSLGTAAEGAGFDIRDQLAWERPGRPKAFSLNHFVKRSGAAAEEQARLLSELDGWKTAQLSPCFEPMILAQKPIQGTLVHNWSQHGVGLMNPSASLDGKFPGNLMSVPRPSRSEKGADNDHPTVKPVRLIEHLIELFSQPGQVVLDPFMGSGSHGVAALKSGRRFIGIEREDRYFQIAMARVAATQIKGANDVLN